MIFFVYGFRKKIEALNPKLFRNLLIDFFHKLEYVFIFSIVFIWSGILINLTVALNNPLKSKFYILYIFLVGLSTVISFIKIYLLEKSIVRNEKNLKLYPKPEMVEFLEKKLEVYFTAYYYLTIISFLISLTIILLNQF
ncbi:MAG: hypothetical protein ACPL25_00460 [Ignavibacteria bacterium]